MLSVLSLAVIAAFSSAQETPAPVVIEIPLKVMYSVPATDKSPGYIVEVPEYVVVDGPEDQDALRIVLPQELIGHRNPIEMPLTVRNGLSRIFKSTNGLAACSGKWTEIVCSFKFENLRVDDVARKNFVRETFPTQDQDAILAVGENFGNDPIGVGRALGRK